MTRNDFFICKAEEEGVAVATATDDNTADEKSGKSVGQLFITRCTRSPPHAAVHELYGIMVFQNILCNTEARTDSHGRI